VRVLAVETAEQMMAACRAALPAEAAVCVAAVADWRVAEPSLGKIKKVAGADAPLLRLVPNPDILAALSAPGVARPRLVVGFAAETDDLLAHAAEKRRRKGCDWLVANDVSPAGGAMGGLENEVHLITAEGVEAWPRMAKAAVAQRLAGRIAEALA
jgi:phosphopantothenoylcysteine decarboxylase/phosphopantothenate--cysteine ligase